MRFYRVCHETRTTRRPGVPVHCGPYIDSGGLEASTLALGALHRMRWEDHNDADHPGIAREFGDRVPFGRRKRYVCGFTSERKARRWFAWFGQALDAAGFVLRVYDVPRESVVTGETQSIALAEDLGEPVETLRLTKLPASRNPYAVAA